MSNIVCPKCKYVRKDNEIAPEYECPQCGIIYLKVKSSLVSKANNDLPRGGNEKRLTSDSRINKQLSKLGEFDAWFTKKEIKHLPEVLRKDEMIMGLASGSFDGNTWLIIVTDQRILFLDKGMIYGLKQLEMHYEQISAISHSMGLLLAKITLSTSSGSKTIDNITKKDAPKICQLISDLIKKTKEPVRIQNNEQTDTVSQLEKLASLLDKGLLTETEFNAQKEKILSI